MPMRFDVFVVKLKYQSSTIYSVGIKYFKWPTLWRQKLCLTRKEAKYVTYGRL